MGVSDLLLDVWRQLAQGGAPFWVMIGGALAALLSIAAYPWSRKPFLPLISLAVSAAGGVLLVEKGRAWMIDAFLRQGDPEAKATHLASGVDLQMNGLAAIGTIVGNGALLAALVMGISWARRRRREKKPIFAALMTAYGLGGLLMVAVRGMLQWALGAIHAFAGIAGVDPSMKASLLRLGLLECGDLVAETKRLLIYGGVVATAAVALRAVRAARRGEMVSNAALATACLLFVAGGVAFAATRARAADADQPLSADSESFIESTLVHPPAVEACGKTSQPGEMAPILFAGDGLFLDGRKVDFAELQEQLITLWNNFRLLHPDDSRTTPMALLVADPQREVQPFLQKWRELKSPYSLRLVALVPQPVHTRTVGTLSRSLTCTYDLTFGKGRKAPRTFGELAKEFSLADQPFSIE